MKSQPARRESWSAADVEAVRAFPLKLAAAWNEGSGEGFAAPFTDDADFIAFEGTHLEGREEIRAFHQQLFETVVKGTSIEGEVKFARFLGPDLAIVHAVARVTLAGQSRPSPSRDSMQLFVAVRRDGEWRVAAVLNARRLTIERQYFLDDLDSLPEEAQREVIDLVASLKERNAAKS